jgi:hypothetical protein
MTGTPILSSRALALGLTYIEARLHHERFGQDVLPSVIRGLSTMAKFETVAVPFQMMGNRGKS